MNNATEGHLLDFLNDLERRYENGVTPEDDGPGLPSGLAGLDDDGGLGPGMWVLTGEPSIGTSAFVHAAAVATALGAGYPAAIVAVEGTALEVFRRVVARLAGVAVCRLVSGDLTDGDWARIAPAIAALVESPLEVTECLASSMADLDEAVRRVRPAEGSPGLVAVDSIDRLPERPSARDLRELVTIGSTLLVVDRSTAGVGDLVPSAAGVLRMRVQGQMPVVERLLDRRWEGPSPAWPVAIRAGTCDIADGSRLEDHPAQLTPEAAP